MMISPLRAAFFEVFFRTVMGGRIRAPVYAFLARPALRDNPQKCPEVRPARGNQSRSLVGGRLSFAGHPRFANDHRLLTRDPQRKSLSRGASPERLWGNSERASVRLVFLFLGGFLLGCHEVFPPFERFVLPRFSTGHLDARATQGLV